MKVLIITNTFFPFGDAMASRIKSFCALFRYIGYEVHVIALYTMSSNEEVNNIYSSEICTYQIASKVGPTSRDSFFGNPAFMQCISKYISQNDIAAIFSTSCSNYFNKINDIARRRAIPYFVEQCEWLNVSSFKFGIIDPRRLLREYLMTYGYKKASGIIAISCFLENHYRNLGQTVVRIPTILDVQSTAFRTGIEENQRTVIVYTGSLGNSKELLAPVIKTLAENLELQSKIQFSIYGPNRQMVLANIGGDEQVLYKTGDSVVIHGRVPQKQILDILIKADYQLFIRPVRRSSDAGFPTKLGESMTAGTPVITNNTGDIGLYLKDGYNGYLLKDNSDASVKAVFEKIVALTQKEKEAMRRKARKTAEESFDYRKYSTQIRELFGV